MLSFCLIAQGRGARLYGSEILLYVDQGNFALRLPATLGCYGGALSQNHPAVQHAMTAPSTLRCHHLQQHLIFLQTDLYMKERIRGLRKGLRYKYATLPALRLCALWKGGGG